MYKLLILFSPTLQYKNYIELSLTLELFNETKQLGIVTSHLGTLQFPWQPSHDIHSVCSSHTNEHTAKPSTIGGVAISPNEHQAGVGIVLQNDLKSGQKENLYEQQKYHQ